MAAGDVWIYAWKMWDTVKNGILSKAQHHWERKSPFCQCLNAPNCAIKCRVPSFCVLPPAFSAEKLSPPGSWQLLVVTCLAPVMNSFPGPTNHEAGEHRKICFHVVGLVSSCSCQSKTPGSCCNSSFTTDSWWLFLPKSLNRCICSLARIFTNHTNSIGRKSLSKIFSASQSRVATRMLSNLHGA